VSDAFCRLVGYDRKELIGKQLDELTAPDSNDTPINFALLSRIGYMQGLWMFITRHNTRVLVRYESWLRPDSNIERHLEPVAANL
jgi:PAS domain-containing protein